MAQHNETGKTGELLAEKFLTSSGFQVMHTNYKQGRNEVDIIAVKDNTLHFIEVKTKAGQGLGLPEQRVNSGKIGRIKRVAESYFEHNPGWKFVQFDIISVTMEDGMDPDIFMIEDVY